MMFKITKTAHMPGQACLARHARPGMPAQAWPARNGQPGMPARHASQACPARPK